MLRAGIINPLILGLLARVRHTNTLVIADRGFPSFPGVEIVDVSLVDDIPRVLDVLRALRPNFVIARAFMAAEFSAHNAADVQQQFAQALGGIPTVHEPHSQFKLRVPGAIGIVRTGDTAPYANLILESG